MAADKKSFTKARFCCFTGWDQNMVPQWKSTEMDYLVYQAEIAPDTGKFHWQGYVEFKKDRMAKTAKALLETGHATHLEKRLGTGLQSSEYCKKDDTAMVPHIRAEHGSLNNAGTTKGGSRTDLKDAERKVIQCAKEGKSLQETMEVVPGLFFKYGTNFEKIYNMHYEVKARMREEIKLRPWQQKVIDLIDKGFVERQIIWIWSYLSKMGKSTFMKYLTTIYGTKNILIGTFKVENLTYMYDSHKIIAFNVPREEELHKTHIAVFESISDGGIHLSTKYAPKMKNIEAVVLVFANIPPPDDRMPERCININIDPPNYKHEEGKIARNLTLDPITGKKLYKFGDKMITQLQFVELHPVDYGNYVIENNEIVLQ